MKTMTETAVNNAIEGVEFQVRPEMKALFDQDCKDLPDTYYARNFLNYLLRWGKLLQVKLQEGFTVDEIIQQTYEDASTNYASDFLKSAVLDALQRFWVHGDNLQHLFVGKGETGKSQVMRWYYSNVPYEGCLPTTQRC